MAKKRRKPRNRPRPATAPARQGGSGKASGGAKASAPDRRPAEPKRNERAERKEQARLVREAARRRIDRRRTIRRAVTIAGVAGIVGIAGFLIFRVGSPGTVSAEALEVARAAGCGDVRTPVGSAPGGEHLQPGESGNYTDLPASSGFHAAAPLPGEPAVYDQPINEEGAVHNLEHGYVILYYRADGSEALPDDVVTRLAGIAESQDKVFVAPYPQLDEGTSLAMVAWNKVWECPSTVSASDAATMAESFIESYKSTSNAPEGNVP